jgi:ferredoxin
MSSTGTEFQVDARTCIRCAACATVAPGNFTVRVGPARVLSAPRDAQELAACRAAAALCPTQAISEPLPAALAELVSGAPSPAPLYPQLLQVAEGARWVPDALPWRAFEMEKATTQLRQVVREMAYSEQTTFSATQRFMHAFADDADFSQWVSVWFYEETRHPMVLLRWLALAGEAPDADFVRRGRVSAPFMKSLVGTLVTNVISEMVAAEAYLRLADSAPEPLLGILARRIGADEARHAASFFAYAQRALERADSERGRLDALKVLHFWFNEGASVSHPVNETMERLRELQSAGGALPPFLPPGDRMAKVIGRLTGLPMNTPDDLPAQLVEFTERVHAAP